MSIYFYITYQSNLKTKTYLCIKTNKVTYFSKTEPVKPYSGKCFYTRRFSNVEYSRYKKMLITKS